ncbi:pyridoxamine 5'-phosphate oxidase family protein [Allocoprobacillus halotolerans]|uniref:Pyridoxamine 5'-phosphate oxidase family protein n=1 Tax=Allocoprobacillus halotolerans TaxID=2944914 RepID=A0ABY5I554_9FIRM|nr:pyridoxamine 5'-phosphate oxidase family protein [Allocoprobacillus halotolerans]UTY39077.1 pyridoxamine 5'-phosphate oxidase family protein [Allocoprobacillus halotolerans]
MDMTSNECLAYIVNEIHSTVFATVDKDSNPITCAIDMMDYDENGLYFLTAKGKSFYDRLKNNSHIAFTGMKGQDTLSSIAVSMQGKVKEIGSDRLTSLFEKIPIC